MDKPKTVGDLMTRDVVTLRRDESLDIADNIMTLGRIRHMPVVDAEGRVVGVVSQRDLYRSALVNSLGVSAAEGRAAMKTVRVDDVMSAPVRSVESDTPLAEAAREMLHHKLGCLPVVEAERLVGILTEADFVQLHAV